MRLHDYQPVDNSCIPHACTPHEQYNLLMHDALLFINTARLHGVVSVAAHLNTIIQ